MTDIKVYIAGPYTHGDVAENVRKAIQVADKIADLGYTPFIPHLAHFWHFYSPKGYESWMEWSGQWLKSCDILFRIEGHSEGSDREEEAARELGIPIVYSISELKEVLNRIYPQSFLNNV